MSNVSDKIYFQSGVKFVEIEFRANICEIFRDCSKTLVPFNTKLKKKSPIVPTNFYFQDKVETNQLEWTWTEVTVLVTGEGTDSICAACRLNFREK